MVQKIHPWGVIGVPNSGPYVKRFQIRELLSKCSILEPSLYNYAKSCGNVKYYSLFGPEPLQILKHNWCLVVLLNCILTWPFPCGKHCPIITIVKITSFRYEVDKLYWNCVLPLLLHNNLPTNLMFIRSVNIHQQ